MTTRIIDCNLTEVMPPCAVSFVVALAMLAALLSGFASASDDDQSNPHWKSDTCDTCHTSTAPDQQNYALLTDQAEQLCERCHGGSGDARQCRHLSGIPAERVTIPEHYRKELKDGQLACTTCHDLTVQCLSPSKPYSFMNPGFIRYRSSLDTSKQCYSCHDVSNFKRLNPHEPGEKTCLLCHFSMPQADGAGWKSVDFNMQDDLNDVCLGCHKVRPHPGSSFSVKPIGWEHLTVPSASVKERMQQTEETSGAHLPLDAYNGKVYCATCHNPHADQLLNYPVAVPQGSEHRLRVDNICQACHDK